MRRFTDDQFDAMLDMFLDEILAEGNDDDVVAFINEEKLDPLMLSADGWTFIHLAAQAGNLSAIQALVHEFGLDVDAKTNPGEEDRPAEDEPPECTLLHLAADDEPPECTALHLAVIGGHEQVVGGLIELQADLNVRDGRGKTPLDYAEELEYKGMVALLKKHGTK